MSKIIKYPMYDGTLKDIEVTDKFAAEYADFVEKERRRVWRENWLKRRHVSLEARIAADWDVIDPNMQDPLDIIIEKEESQFEIPMFTNLTEYQQRVAHKYFVLHKTHDQIAKEEGVSRPVISKLILKIQKKIVGLFD